MVNQGKVHTFAASLERGAGKTAFRTQNKDASQVVVKVWRDGRVVDYNGLENRRTERYRGFESLSLRIESCKSKDLQDFSFLCFKVVLLLIFGLPLYKNIYLYS